MSAMNDDRNASCFENTKNIDPRDREPAPLAYHDVTGRPIKPGDFIVYAVTQGSSAAEMKFGRVLELRERETYRQGRWPWCSCLTVSKFFRDSAYELQNKGKPVAINLAAMLVIPASRVPAEARALLKVRP